MGINDFLKTLVPEPRVMAAIRVESKQENKKTLSMRDIDREIGAYRRERKLKDAAK